MVWPALVYRLAGHHLREWLAATGQTAPQLKQPMERPRIRLMFQCLEGISLVCFVPLYGHTYHKIAGLLPPNEKVVTLLGPSCQLFY